MMERIRFDPTALQFAGRSDLVAGMEPLSTDATSSIFSDPGMNMRDLFAEDVRASFRQLRAPSSSVQKTSAFSQSARSAQRKNRGCGATTIAGLDPQRQPSENELAGARYQGRAIAETSGASRTRQRPRRVDRAQSSGTMLAGWRRRRKTRTPFNRPSTTCSPTYGERAARFGFRAWMSSRRLRA
jgi:hypothetical protein